MAIGKNVCTIAPREESLGNLAIDSHGRVLAGVLNTLGGCRLKSLSLEAKGPVLATHRHIVWVEDTYVDRFVSDGSGDILLNRKGDSERLHLINACGSLAPSVER